MGWRHTYLSGQFTQQGGFATAIRPGEQQAFSRGHREGDVPDQDFVPVTYMLQFDFHVFAILLKLNAFL
jgi:hypothetical protein